MAKKYKPEVRFEIECEPEQDDVRGYFASGDDAQDRADEDAILERLERGEVWAWCSVRVKAIAEDGGEAYSDWLGGCSYADEADFRHENNDYFSDMCDEARRQLLTVEHSFRQGIQTKYCGPTNSKGARVKVWAQAGVRYVSWDHALNSEENHAAAAQKFADEWQWTGRWLGGALPDGTGYLFVNDRKRG